MIEEGGVEDRHARNESEARLHADELVQVDLRAGVVRIVVQIDAGENDEHYHARKQQV